MFGMSSKEFWEDDPKLYWAYRTFYLKTIEAEQKEKYEMMKYSAWLNGNMTSMAVSVALNNAFTKNPKEFPSYEEAFGELEKESKKEPLTKKEANLMVQEEFNTWARY